METTKCYSNLAKIVPVQMIRCRIVGAEEIVNLTSHAKSAKRVIYILILVTESLKKVRYIFEIKRMVLVLCFLLL